jgi:signal transduction histidine kinase
MPPYPWWPEESHEKYAGDLSKDIRTGRMKKTERHIIRRDGKDIWVESYIRSLAKKSGTGHHFIYLADITQRKHLDENMQFYLAEITRAQEAERKRIALEIHDEIIQSLATLSLQIDALGKDKTRLREDLPKLLGSLRDGIQEMASRLRGLSHSLHPSIIDQGLIMALEHLTSQITDMDIQFITYGNERRLPVETELNLFRIAQEATRNIIKHSGATEAMIKLRYTSKGVKLMISDNGIGFDLPEEWSELAGKRKLGIISMQERAYLINGKFSLRSTMGKGTVVMVEVTRQ